MTDLPLDHEYALALAAFYDACPDPDCRCVDTLRGLDRAGCPVHDPEEDRR